MAGVEALRASLRWFEHVQKEESSVRRKDDWVVVISGAGSCSEVLRLVNEGIEKRVLRREMLGGDEKLAKLWDDLSAENPSEIIRRVHRIRDKYFSHWDRKVIEHFVKLQTKEQETEPFIESDADGKFLNTRYLCPGAAFAYDFAADITDITVPEKRQRVGELLRDLGTLWSGTTKLVSLLLAEALRQSGLRFEPVRESE
jgi:hypothetical protein